MLGKWTGPTCWVNLTQHVFCPLCNQRWVGKQPNLGWKQPSTFESVGNCYYRSTRKSIQTIFSDVGSLVKTCAKVRCLGVTFVSKTADRSACFDWLIDHVFGWRVHFIINKPDNKVLSSKRNKRFCNLCTGNLIGDEFHILFEKSDHYGKSKNVFNQVLCLPPLSV